MSDIIISKINNNPPERDRRKDGKWINPVEEYVELKNISDTDVDISGWTLEDQPSSKRPGKYKHTFVFPDGTKIKATSILRVRTGSKIGRGGEGSIYQNRKMPIWNNEGDKAILRKPNRDEESNLTIGEILLEIERPSQITISGHINDAVCRQPIVNAKLKFQALKGQEEVNTTTDEEGYYKTELTGGKDYTLTITVTNYDALSDTINTQIGKDIKKDFQLNPNLEIELGIDSTEVKFTQKDKNLVDAVQDLIDKVTVDINADYTFTVNVSIKKGLTNYIKATLLENNKDIKNFKEDFNCRIDDTGKIWITGFNSCRNNWKWYHIGWFWLAEKDKTEKTFEYAVSLIGKYGEKNVYISRSPIKIGKVVIKVNKDKLLALEAHNRLIGIQWAAGIGAIIAAIIAVIFIFPALALALGISLATGTAGAYAAISSLISGSLSAAWGLIESLKADCLSAMDDPPEFDEGYKKLIKISSRFAQRKISVKRLSLVRSAIVVSRNRLYSAYIKRDKKIMKRQAKHIQNLLMHNKLALTDTLHELKTINKTLKEHRKHFAPHIISKTRELIKSGKVPKKMLLSKLKRMGISKLQANILLEIAKNKKIKNKELNPLSKLCQLPNIISQANKQFTKSIEKEIKQYGNI